MEKQHSLFQNESRFGQDYPYKNMGSQKLFQNSQPSQENDRTITCYRPDLDLPDNSIHTCKYNLLTFLPKNLFIQYMKIANIYFLSLGVLQLFPTISNSEGQPTVWLPLFIINIATSLKDLYEDLKRRHSDSEENNTQTVKIEKMGESKIAWQDLRVGEIIRVERNEYFPADILILDTSEPKGICYIETKNLDGETNLKQKIVQQDLYQFESNKKYQDNHFILEYERPNAYLYKFNGRVLLPSDITLPMDANNFILRGCSLRNTKWAIGLVAYTGHDTKLFMNCFTSRTKFSHLEDQMSRQIILIFLFMILMSLFGSTFNLITMDKNEHELGYIRIQRENDFIVFFTSFFSWILNLSNLVPISLLVTMEVVKMSQGMLISKDQGMIYQATQISTQVQSSSLNEELGQIEYVFTDKTGTLTCNIMEYKKISINGKSYGECKKGQQNYMDDIKAYPKVTNVDFRDKSFLQIIENGIFLFSIRQVSSGEFEHIRKALFLLALCHTIVIERIDGQITYNASSPDELALINFAKFCGVNYLGCNEDNIMEVKFKEQVYKYKLLHVLEVFFFFDKQFDSTRKRMSVILRDLNVKDKPIILFTKGADSIILDRINRSKYLRNNKDQNEDFNHDATVLENTTQQLTDYGNIGLRTLLLAEKQLEQSFFDQWNTKYLEASASLEKRDEKMDELQNQIEIDLVIVGATAIQDKLQDQVAETIEALLKAGIKVWVLTGDKIETAINIAMSCKLLTTDMEKLIVDEKEEAQLIQSLEECLKQLDSFANKKEVAFVISGDSLLHGLKSSISKKIMVIAAQCSAVVCCRVSPKQKQEVVSLVRKERPNVATLAIGDGANDVNMITAAHVGIGIKGLEGAQAARASDYAIGEFKLLRRLMFYHGRECYRRNSQLILYNFYKNTLLALPIFYIGSVDYFSGPSIYDNYTYQFFNVFFAALPIMIFSILDSEFQAHDLEHNYRNFYEDGQKSKLFNIKIFWLSILYAALQSAIIFTVSILSIGQNFTNNDGLQLQFWSTGAMIFGMVVVVSNLKILIISSDHSIASVVVIVGSMIAYLISLTIVTNILFTGDQLYMDFLPLFTTPAFHFGNILIIFSTSLFDAAIEWHNRWVVSLSRKNDYIKRLEGELKKEEDDIVFLAEVVSNQSQYKKQLVIYQKDLRFLKPINQSMVAQTIIAKTIIAKTIIAKTIIIKTIIIKTIIINLIKIKLNIKINKLHTLVPEMYNTIITIKILF